MKKLWLRTHYVYKNYLMIHFRAVNATTIINHAVLHGYKNERRQKIDVEYLYNTVEDLIFQCNLVFRTCY